MRRNTFIIKLSFTLAWEKQAAGLHWAAGSPQQLLASSKEIMGPKMTFESKRGGGGRRQGGVQLKALFSFLQGRVNGKTLIFAFPFPFGPHCLRAQSGDNFPAHLCLL